MSPVGAILVPFPPKTETKSLHPCPPQSLNGSRVLLCIHVLFSAASLCFFSAVVNNVGVPVHVLPI